MAQELPRPLRGIIPPLVTPLVAPDRLDEEALERLIEKLIGAGVDGLFVLGTTGEGPNLAYSLRRELIRQACKIAGGRKPVLAGITDCSVREAADLAGHAAEAGAAAVVFAAPYYFPMSQQDLLGFSLALAERLPLPFFVYDIPSHTRNGFALDTVRRIAEHPLCHGIKDSSGDLDHFSALIEAFKSRGDFAVLMGPEELLLMALQAGAHGGVTGGANLYPELYVGVYQAAREKRWREAAELQGLILMLSQGIYSSVEGPSAYLRTLKCALELRGICSGVLTESFAPVPAAVRERIRATLMALGLEAP